MRTLKKSLVAWSLGGSLLSFTALLYILPYERFLDLSLALAFGVTFAATIRYGRDAVDAFRSGKSGAEFLIVAVFAIVSVLLGQRVWGITLRILNRPDWLVDSPISILVPWLLAWAISLALVAPDIDLEPDGLRSGLWKSVALFIGGALAGFVVASSFSKGSVELSDVSVWPIYANRAQCPSTEPVWVSSNGIYHTRLSPYRSGVVARWCFSTPEEAQAAGFRPPKGIERNKIP